VSELLRAIVLGIIQGLTEFLPVSSSGHLELAKVILGDTAVAEESMMMTLADKAKNTDKGVGIKEALIIGVSQAIAILPGISRSGATISTSVLLGVDRSKAARFSFLMVVPLIFGKIAKDLLDGDVMAQASNWQPYTVGFIAAFITGVVACTLMIQLVKRSQLRFFAFYCFAVAILAIGYGFMQG